MRLALEIHNIGLLCLILMSFLGSESFAQQNHCVQDAIESKIQELPNMDDKELDALISCGESIVPFLIPVLSSQDIEVLYPATEVLYSIAAENQKTPNLLLASGVVRDHLLNSSVPEITGQ